MQTTNISCAACGTDFSFSQEERDFYESKGFQPPRKCKPCRDAAKQNRDGGGYGRGYDRPQRAMYDAVCTSCGTNTQVPFQPNGSKPVYCQGCFQG